MIFDQLHGVILTDWEGLDIKINSDWYKSEGLLILGNIKKY